MNSKERGRPDYCQIIECPQYTSICPLDLQVKKYFGSAVGRKAERERLFHQAIDDREELIRKCAQTWLDR
ncbi:hypothetical protein C4579_03310 [Candidatus Microgenomates bacterium]|nr:MAG: hypothetical protein C4579_03310 [Candidatus Microgenomates bacterium]